MLRGECVMERQRESVSPLCLAVYVPSTFLKDFEAFKALLTAGTTDEQLRALGELTYQIQQRYRDATGYLPSIFDGSSPGAGSHVG
ncbi:hypothetical protein COCNU_01G008080 [Cocos nucifera]|uniref:Uncharacterized protein n=1 Tax=Cocos nucifera TaxID=13894 RepID=A0A8K0MUQ1_COCNU|nr:hypothetical protein COCNU_01G008080 [Cocos nucifera]